MKSTIQLDTKDIRQILSIFFDIPPEKVIPNRYTFSIEGIDEAEIVSKIRRETGTNRQTKTDIPRDG